MTNIPACRAGWSHEHPYGDHMDLSSVCIPLLRSCLQQLSYGMLESCFLNRHANAYASRVFVSIAKHTHKEINMHEGLATISTKVISGSTEQMINMLTVQLRYMSNAMTHV